MSRLLTQAFISVYYKVLVTSNILLTARYKQPVRDRPFTFLSRHRQADLPGEGKGRRQSRGNVAMTGMVGDADGVLGEHQLFQHFVGCCSLVTDFS